MSEQRKGRWRFGVLTVVTAAFLATFILGFVIPLFQKTARSARLEENLDNAKQTVTALHKYAYDHDGRFPESLEALVPLYSSTNGPLLNTVADGKTKVPWHYFPGHIPDEKPRVIVFTSQPDSEGSRVVGYTDGWVRIETQPAQ